jgi:hypothetical protein
MYGRMPPWRKATSSSGVSILTTAVNSVAVPSPAVERTRTCPRGLSDPTPTMSNASRPVSVSAATLSPYVNSSGSTPQFTRLLRWMRS